jgi:hypothetical protein
MMLKNNLIILCLIYLTGGLNRALTAQQEPLFFRKWHITNDQKPEVTQGIQSIVKDNYGRIWLATREGLKYYDGIRIKPIEGIPPALQEVTITCILIDSKQRLWAGTFEHGIFSYNLLTREVKYYRYNPDESCQLPDNRIMYIHESAKGEIWISAHQQGIAKYTEDVYCPFQSYLPEKDPDILREKSHFSNIVTSIKNDNNDPDILWLGTMRGLWRYTAKSNQITPFYLDSDGLINGVDEANSIRNMYVTTESKSKIWLATWGGGIWCFDIHKESFDRRLFGTGQLKDNNFQAMVPLSDSTFLLGAPMRGLCIFYLKKNELFWYDEIPGNFSDIVSPTSIFKENSDIWIIDGGNNYLYSNTRSDYIKRHRLSSTSIHMTKMGKDGRLYSISGYEKCLYISSPNSSYEEKICVPQNPENKEEKFIDLAFSPDETIFVLSNLNLYFRNEKNYLQPVSAGLFQQINMPHTLFLCMEVDDEGGIWIGTNWEGLIYIDPVLKQTKAFQASDKQDGLVHTFWVSFLNKDHRGNIWYTTEKGFGVFDLKKKSFTNFPYDPSRSDDKYTDFKRVTALYLHPKLNKLYIGSPIGGFGSLSSDSVDSKISSIVRNNGLPVSRIRQILPDEKQHLLILTEKGIFTYDPYSQEINNAGLEINQEGIRYLERNGDQLIVTLSNGYLITSLDKLNSQSLDLQPILTGFVSNGNTWSPDQFLTSDFKKFHHNENFFSFEFGPSHIMYHASSDFAWILEGLENVWNEPGEVNTSTYAGVPPGKYKLLAKIRTSGGDWSEPYQLMQFRIVPPFYRTIWFYSLILLIIIAMVYTIYSIRIRQIRREESLKQTFNKQVAESELKALRAQMNPHFLFNSLNSIKVFIIENDTEGASLHLNKFARLLGLILENSESSMIPLIKELDALKLYLELEKLRFNHTFDFNIDVDPDLDTERILFPPLLLQPFVENAIWHGLLPSDTQGHLLVRLQKNKDKLCICVEDNGIGREAAGKRKPSTGRVRSMGVANTRKRLELVNELFPLEARLEISDLKAPTGTRVELTMNILNVSDHQIFKQAEAIH